MGRKRTHEFSEALYCAADLNMTQPQVSAAFQGGAALDFWLSRREA
ncbi:MAG: hypothetical protein ABIR51_01275 [Sphingomicrobium sp.]